MGTAQVNEEERTLVELFGPRALAAFHGVNYCGEHGCCVDSPDSGTMRWRPPDDNEQPEERPW